MFVGGKGPNSRVNHYRGREGIGGRVQILVLSSTINPWGREDGEGFSVVGGSEGPNSRVDHRGTEGDRREDPNSRIDFHN